MVEIAIENGRLWMRVVGWHRVWALKTQLDFALSQVREVRLDPTAAARPHGWRAPGTFVPGILTAGTFYRKGGRDFWDVRHPERALVIELEGASFARLIVEVTDPHRTLELISQSRARTL